LCLLQAQEVVRFRRRLEDKVWDPDREKQLTAAKDVLLDDGTKGYMPMMLMMLCL
jgi:hypothetical protein